MTREDCEKYIEAVKNTKESNTRLYLILTPFKTHKDYERIVGFNEAKKKYIKDNIKILENH